MCPPRALIAPVWTQLHAAKKQLAEHDAASALTTLALAPEPVASPASSALAAQSALPALSEPSALTAPTASTAPAAITDAHAEANEHKSAADDDFRVEVYKFMLCSAGASWKKIFLSRVVPQPVSNYAIMGTITAPALALVFSKMDFRHGDVFCDLGCGNGAVLCAARCVAPGINVVGVDGDEELVTAAKGNLMERFKMREPRLEHRTIEQLRDAGKGVTQVFSFTEGLRGGDATAEHLIRICRATPTLRVATFVHSRRRSSHPIVAFGSRAEEEGTAVSFTVRQHGSNRPYTAWIVQMGSYLYGENEAPLPVDAATWPTKFRSLATRLESGLAALGKWDGRYANCQDGVTWMSLPSCKSARDWTCMLDLSMKSELACMIVTGTNVPLRQHEAMFNMIVDRLANSRLIALNAGEFNVDAAAYDALEEAIAQDSCILGHFYMNDCVSTDDKARKTRIRAQLRLNRLKAGYLEQLARDEVYALGGANCWSNFTENTRKRALAHVGRVS